MLRAKDLVGSPEDMGHWLRELLVQDLIEIPVDGGIGIRANALDGFHADPADRIIVATALDGHRLVTAGRADLGHGRQSRPPGREAVMVAKSAPNVPDGWQVYAQGGPGQHGEIPVESLTVASGSGDAQLRRPACGHFRAGRW